MTPLSTVYAYIQAYTGNMTLIPNKYAQDSRQTHALLAHYGYYGIAIAVVCLCSSSAPSPEYVVQLGLAQVWQMD